MRPKIKVLTFLVLSIGLSGAMTTQAIDSDEYVAAVMNVLRTHVNLMQELSDAHRSKYSVNQVRHAVAIERTFGLLGPMEWHAAEAARLHRQHQGNNGELDEERFEKLARASRQSLRDLVRAAHDSMEEYDQEGLLNAVQEMKQSCDNCHSLLPKAVAPDLWGPLERQ